MEYSCQNGEIQACLSNLTFIFKFGIIEDRMPTCVGKAKWSPYKERVMNQDRQFQIFRAMIKDMVREKVHLDRLDFRSEGNEVKGLNKRHHFEPPLTVEELGEIYLELGQEAATEHFAQVKEALERKRAQGDSQDEQE